MDYVIAALPILIFVGLFVVYFIYAFKSRKATNESTIKVVESNIRLADAVNRLADTISKR